MLEAVQRASYFAYTTGARIAQLLPPRLGRPLAGAAGRGSARFLRARRDQVARNLVRILGPMPARELRARVRLTFRNYGRYWYEFFRLAHEPPATVLERMHAVGYEHLAAAIDAGTGAIVVVPHLAGYDLAGAWLAARGRKLTVVVEPVEPPELFEWFAEQRRALGMEVVALGPDVAHTLARAIDDNHTVALVADRDLTGDGVEVDFFGETTTMPGGPAVLAFRTGAPILPAAVYFAAGDAYVAHVEPPIPTERRGRLRDDVFRVTQMIAHRFEPLIRRAPEQWFVLQPNWPTDRG